MQVFKIALTTLIIFGAGSAYSSSLLITPQLLAQTQITSKTAASQLFKQGLEQYQKRQLEAAIKTWQQALSMYQELQDQQGEKAALSGLGAAYLELANYSKAIESMQALLPIAKATSDRKTEAQALGNLGIAYKELGKYDKAIKSQQQALVLMQEIKDRQGEGQVLGNLGNAYEAVGDYEQSIDAYQQSLSIAKETKDPSGQAVTLANIGAIFANLGKYKQAIDSYKQSLAIAQFINDKLGEANTLNNLGIAYHAQKNIAKAIESYTQALTIARAINDRRMEAITLGGLGLAYADQRQYTKAIEQQQQTLKIAQAIGDRRLEGLALNNQGHTLFISGKLSEAEQKLQEALKVLESLRPGLTDADKISIFDTQVFSYNLLQKIHIAQNKYEAALEVAEQGRARAFVELLASRLSPEVAEKNINIQPPTISQIKQTAKNHQATLVEYSIVPGNDFKFQGKLKAPATDLFIWVVQPTGKVEFRRADLKSLLAPESNTPTTLEELVRISRNSNGPGAIRSQIARKQLHKLLIEPIAELLPKEPTERVIFIPQESLFLLPFPALEDATGQYLIAKHTMLTAPAIQVLDLTRQQQQRLQTKYRQPFPGKDIIVVGNPKMPADLEPLPAAEQEALAIAQIFNTKAIIGDQATKVDIVQKLPNARLVHLATHGLLSDAKKVGIPGALAFTPSQNDDGFLTSTEIFNLKLNAQLVVLSACNTGRGKITGDGVIGLSRAFITSGVSSLVVSLWSVPDAPTSLLMTEFYRNLQNNSDKAQALRQAMLITMKKTPNPYNWAAFTLIGEAD
ncbi:MAG: CHAT domain-containing protein [Coleofasciculaceae cyanobacterium]